MTPSAVGAGRSSRVESAPHRQADPQRLRDREDDGGSGAAHRRADDGRDPSATHEVPLLQQGGVRHARAVRHEEHGEDGAHEVDGGGACGRAEHVVATRDPIVERADAVPDAVGELEVARELADAVGAGLDRLGGVGRHRLEPVEGLLHLVEDEVGHPHAEHGQPRKGDQHRGYPADVDRETIDDRVQQHRGDHRGRRPGERPVGRHEDASGHDQAHDGAHDRQRRRWGEPDQPSLHGPHRAVHPAVPYRA